MKYRNFLWLFAAVVILFISGGCGSSKSNNFAPTDSKFSNANAIFEKSAWRYSSGTVTANVNGETENLTVYDFAVYFDNCDIEDEDDEGTARFAAFAILKGKYFTLPLLFDFSDISTTREGNSWTAITEHGDFTIELTSETEARMTGTIAYKIGDDVEADIDIVIKKYDASAGPTINLDDVLNATWMTLDNDENNSQYGGGYVYSSTDGAIPIDKIFSSWTFKNTSLTENKTIGAMQLVTSGLNDSEFYYYTVDDEDFSVSHIFGSVYRFSATDTVGGVHVELTGALVFHDANTAYFITSFTADEGGELAVQHYAIPMFRKTDESGKINLREKINTTWEAQYGIAYIDYTDSETEAKLESFTVTFTSADINEKTLTLSAGGTFKVEGENRTVDFGSITLNFDNIGYNTWTGDSANGSSFTISMLDDDTAILTANVFYDNEIIYAVGLMRQVSE